jgi:hypothetical protein
MTRDKLRVTNTTDGHAFDIYPLRGVGEQGTKDALSIAPPGRAASENILLGLKGMEADIPVRFYGHDDGTDKANGTAPTGEYANDTVVTIAEQRDYLRRFIHAPEFDVSHTLDHLTGEEFNDDEVYLERRDTPTLEQGSPKWHEWELGFRRGGSV